MPSAGRSSSGMFESSESFPKKISRWQCLIKRRVFVAQFLCERKLLSWQIGGKKKEQLYLCEIHLFALHLTLPLSVTHAHAHTYKLNWLFQFGRSNMTVIFSSRHAQRRGSSLNFVIRTVRHQNQRSFLSLNETDDHFHIFQVNTNIKSTKKTLI